MIEDFVYLEAKLGVESFRKARPGRSKTDARTTTPVLQRQRTPVSGAAPSLAGRNSPVWPHVLFKSYILFIMERKFRADRSNN
jgi:hypothetical protein